MIEMTKAEMDRLLDAVLLKKPKILEFPSDIAHRDVVLYGGGNLANLAINMINGVGVKIKYIVDGNPEIQGKSIKGIPIRSPDDVNIEDTRNLIFVVCVVTYPYEKIRSRLKEMGCTEVYPFYDYMIYFRDKVELVNSWISSLLSLDDIKKIRHVYNSFADIRSKAAYLQVLYWRISREEIEFNNNPVTMRDKFFPDGIMPPLHNDEFLLDCGAYTGNTIKLFMQKTAGRFKKIYSYEPDSENYSALVRYVMTLDDDTKRKIIIFNAGMGDQKGNFPFVQGNDIASRFSPLYGTSAVPKVTIDEEMNDKDPTLIKIHAEGDELSIVRGGMKTIQRCRPILVITIYHSQQDLWELPVYLITKLKDYTYFHRNHAYCGIESVLYAFPVERISS